MNHSSIIYSVVLSLFTLTGFAQDQYGDSLKSILGSNIHDTTRARIYIDLAEYFTDEKDWLPYNEKALKLANERIPTARGKLKTEFIRVKASAKANYGFHYDSHGQKELSLENYYSALKLFDQIHDEESKAVIYSNLGVIMSNQKDNEEAIDYLKKALAIKLKYDRADIAKNYINLGVAYENSGDSLTGLDYYGKAYDAALKAGDHIDMSTALNNIGSHHFQHREYSKAIPYLARAVDECEQGGDESGSAWIIANLGMAYLNYGMTDSAAFHLFRAKEIADRYSFPYLTETVAEKLYYYYSRKKDWENAHKQYVIHQKLTDSLENVSAQKEALRQKMEYDHGLETARFELVREEERKREQQRTIFILIATALILIIAIVMYSRFKATKKQKLIIEVQKSEVEEKNREITDSINYARYVQQAILPVESVLFSGFSDGFLIYRPKDIVAGDFYWRKEHSGKILLAVADCTGHGVPGAMVSVVCANALDKAIESVSEPGEILDRTREIVIGQLSSDEREVRDGMDIGLLEVDRMNKKLKYSGAHISCWIRSGNEWNVLKGARQPIGNFEHSNPFETLEAELKEGDWVYLFSDGIADQFGGPDHKKLKSVGLKTLLEKLDNLDGTMRWEALTSELSKWMAGHDQTDDMCLIGIKL